MKTYLVTGGAGFIGSNLCKTLVKEHKVIVLDDLSTGKKDNLVDGVELVEGSVLDYKLLKDLLLKVDGCFHLAAVVSITMCNENPLYAHEVNLTGTMNILQAISELSCPKNQIPLVFASSSAVYGDNQNLPNRETTPTAPLSVYASTKLCSEFYGTFMNQLHKVPFTALRLFNVYGYGQRLDNPYSGVISIFLNNLLTAKACTIFGDGNQSRDFVYVEDVVRFFIKAMQTSTDKARIFNVCRGKAITILKLAETLSELKQSPLNVVHQPPKPGDIIHSLGEPLSAQKELGITAETEVFTGLKKLVDLVG